MSDDAAWQELLKRQQELRAELKKVNKLIRDIKRLARKYEKEGLSSAENP